MKAVAYREERDVSRPYKEAYAAQIKKLIDQREKEGEALRERFAKEIFRDPETYRQKFRAMLGWPLTIIEKKPVPRAKSELLYQDEDGSIERVSIEILDNLFMTGLLFLQDKEKRPLIIAQHGGSGTPELIGNFYGNTYNYSHMLERILECGAHVFAPQLLIWDPSYGAEFDRLALDARLKRTGSSIAALEIYGIIRCLDYLEQQAYTGGFGMVGLSYGGFYTLFTAAAEPRIQAAISCSFFNQRKNYAVSDFTWFGAAQTFSDAEAACLIYPRRLWLETGTRDELFDIQSVRKEVSRLQRLAASTEQEWLKFIEFDGAHEFCPENEPIQELVKIIKEN